MKINNSLHTEFYLKATEHNFEITHLGNLWVVCLRYASLTNPFWKDFQFRDVTQIVSDISAWAQSKTKVFPDLSDFWHEIRQASAHNDKLPASFGEFMQIPTNFYQAYALWMIPNNDGDFTWIFNRFEKGERDGSFTINHSDILADIAGWSLDNLNSRASRHELIVMAAAAFQKLLTQLPKGTYSEFGPFANLITQ
jgi:hypothetical protein